MKKILQLVFLLFPVFSFAQKNKAYDDSIIAFRENYISTHGIVKGEDKKKLSFYKPDEFFLVNADFISETGEKKIVMKTSAGTVKEFTKYGKLNFMLKGESMHLYLYKSEEVSKMPGYEDYLFLPFTDNTNGDKTYGGGRYIDFRSTEIKDGKVKIDFNKAYNPYCAYTTGFKCPIPPRENNLDIDIKAGEKSYTKSAH